MMLFRYFPLASAFLSLFAVSIQAERVVAPSFTIEEGFYVDKGKWLAVNPNKAQSGEASLVFPYSDGEYDVTLEMVGESDGQCNYEVQIEQTMLGTVECPLSGETFEEGQRYHKTWKGVRIYDGDIVRVRATIHSADGKEWSRARWAAMRFERVGGAASGGSVSGSAGMVEPEGMAAVRRLPDGDGSVTVSGELKKWHNVILTLDGPFAHELDTNPNPFIDREMNVRFRHESGSPEYLVPAYFAADGNAGNSSAESGTKWRAHLAPDKAGLWHYEIEFVDTSYHGSKGSFEVAASDKSGRDYRGKGRLEYVGSRYLRFADSGEWFLKAGADAPETLLGYADFDATRSPEKGRAPLKTWAPHLGDWKAGDPVWKDGRGKGLIGAINYLASTGCNAFSFLTYNAGGDGDNVWPHVSRADKLHFDCSKLDQWGVVFEHGTAQGMYLHFKLQETENDDLKGKNEAGKANALDKGELGPERKAYLREIIARFGHNLALNWNIGEENTQTKEQIEAIAAFIRKTDPYGHNVVLHTYPGQQDKVYGDFIGREDMLTGVSIQNSDVARSHKDALRWVKRSEAADHPWVVAMDEAGNAGSGTPPDPDWPGVQETREKIGDKLKIPTIDEIRAEVLWGTLLAGGTGVEYYFGYQLPENDLNAEDWRSRAMTWHYSSIALDFFQRSGVPFWEMSNANAMVGNPDNGNERYCLAKSGESYLIYLRQASAPFELDLSAAKGSFSVRWFNPRSGGEMQMGSVKTVRGGRSVKLGQAPSDADADWVVLVSR